ncbi:lipid A deacylase LpxR family protein [uncultured Polaribacter sp.]|uniref:lipid A deacylase LpxR family protein n=1 Tax=uncultured Polaribacter sp. TaxID=174711 RepID=UPI00260B8741|nr:lipid A deacylase LpxR family protein [uncultured Polaribacter sp.]
MKKILVLLFFSSSILAFSQKKYSKEISFITENDLYTSTYDDRYYTNGMFLSFKYLSKEKKNNLEKKVLAWEIGHRMYTPAVPLVKSVEEHDRSFAGYLYGSFGINRIYKKDKSFHTTIQLGVLGSNAYAKELQGFIHNIYGFRKTVGWKHQIKDAFAINFNTAYNAFLLKDSSNHFDIFWTNSGKIGTVFTDLSTGLLARIGLKPLQSLANSIAFNTNLNDKNTSYFRETESFFYIKPSLRYVLYDATFQGSFLNKGSEVTNELIPLVFNLEIGFRFTANRFNFGYVYNYNSNKAKNLRFDNGHTYGSVILNYLLK